MMRDWERVAEQIKEEAKQALHKRLVEAAIGVMCENQEFDWNVKGDIPDMTPSDLQDVLTSLGWDYEMLDTNGWEQDTWYEFDNVDYSFTLVMFYSGFYGSLTLHRKDIDD